MWAAHDFSPVALIRDSRQQTKFTALGLPSVVGDLEAGIADFLQGMDVVVFTAGSGGHTGPEKTIDVDQNAAVRLIKDCKKQGVRRFVMVSSMNLPFQYCALYTSSTFSLLNTTIPARFSDFKL